MKKIMIALGLFVATNIYAQDKVETTVAADIVSQYIWRGQDLGNVSLQPTLGVAYKGFSLSAWGSVGLADAKDTKEFDLTLGYATGGFNIGITDYWFNTGLDPMNRYFKYDAHATNHVFEANVGYDFGLASIQWFSNFGGNDGTNKDGKRAYSSYVELAAIPAPSPSFPTSAPRCRMFSNTLSAWSTNSWLLFPWIFTTIPTPHASCSCSDW